MHTRRRGDSGFTIVEILVSVILMSLITMVLAGMLYLNNHAGQKISNKIDTINASKVAIERIGRDVRQARSIGDVFGADLQVPGTGTDPVNNPAAYYTQGSATFPSANDPLYGPNGVRPTGFQGFPADWGTSWTCNNTTLVVQIPIFDNNNPSATPGGVDFGFPTKIAANSVAAGIPASDQANVETHIYRVIQDPDIVNHPGQYILQMARIPGQRVTDSAGTVIYNPATVPTTPQTLLTGIVGPLDPAGSNPKVFQYLNKTRTGNAATPLDPPLTDTDVPDYTGVCINLEVLKQQRVGDKSKSYLAFKSEVFLRNNALATTTGQPSQVSGSTGHSQGGN